MAKSIGLLASPFFVLAMLAAPAMADPEDPTMGLLPDLQTVVIKHMQIQNEHGREMLRLTNGIANTGPGHLLLIPDCTPVTAGGDGCPDPGDGELVTTATQEILDAAGNVVLSKVVSSFEFHPTHNHWHLEDIARFEVFHADDDGSGGDWGPLLRNDLDQDAVADKVGFCLIDSYRIADGKSKTPDRIFWDCEVAEQGIQSGWIDQYHQSLDDMEIDLTGAPEGLYYLVSTSNPRNLYIEETETNNRTWISFELSRHSNGNPKVHIVDHAPCDNDALCGAYKRNGP